MVEVNYWKKIKEKDLKIKPEIKDSLKIIKTNVKELFIKALEKRWPRERFVILFSGGIDSGFIAYLSKKHKKNFICYTAVLDEKSMDTAKDLIYAKKAAKKYNLKLKIIKIKLNKAEKIIPKIIKITGKNDVVTVGVGLPVYFCLEQAKKDKIKTVFTGLGSEEIFAGYERHRLSSNINKECQRGLLKIYNRDLIRDSKLAEYFKVNLRCPFLDKDLVNYSLRIPEKYKIVKNQSKVVLREVAKDLKYDKELSERKKLAAQYGSKFDKAIKKLANKHGFKSKDEYLKSIC
ncbi:MAG: asparagine synthase C-terminal domain-containing protein [Candidatus Nanoarchaeia archaeon]|nr:asparagine synthase C-terminal domain-containing protein [Candidatus Nanoarchaeia archaeon]